MLLMMQVIFLFTPWISCLFKNESLTLATENKVVLNIRKHLRAILNVIVNIPISRIQMAVSALQIKYHYGTFRILITIETIKVAAIIIIRTTRTTRTQASIIIFLVIRAIIKAHMFKFR